MTISLESNSSRDLPLATYKPIKSQEEMVITKHLFTAKSLTTDSEENDVFMNNFLCAMEKITINQNIRIMFALGKFTPLNV